MPTSRKTYRHPALARALKKEGACSRFTESAMEHAARHPTLARAVAYARSRFWMIWAQRHLATDADRESVGHEARQVALFRIALEVPPILTINERAREYDRSDRRAVMAWAKRIDAQVARARRRTRRAARITASRRAA